MVPPGRNSPLASAASIILIAMRSLTLPPGLTYSTLATTAPMPSGTTEFNCTRGVLPMSSLTCRAMRIRPSSQAPADRLPGGLSDVVTDLPKRPGGLRHRGCCQLEHMHLAWPDPQLDGDPCGGQHVGGLAGVADEHFRTRHMDQCAGKPGLDVVERLVDLLGFSVDDMPFGSLVDQFDERVKCLGREHRITVDVRVVA